MPKGKRPYLKKSHMSPEEQSRFTSGLHMCIYGADTEVCLHSRIHRGALKLGKEKCCESVEKQGTGEHRVQC